MSDVSIVHACKICFLCDPFGEMPEWPIGAVSKTVIRASGSRVRIPVSPPIQSPAQQHSKSEGAPDVSSECGGGFVVCFAKQRGDWIEALPFGDHVSNPCLSVLCK